MNNEQELVDIEYLEELKADAETCNYFKAICTFLVLAQTLEIGLIASLVVM